VVTVSLYQWESDHLSVKSFTMNIRLFGLGGAFVGIFCIWTLLAIQYAASFSNCNPGFGCSVGAPVETTIGMIILPGVILLGLFIVVLARNRQVPHSPC